ncbi:MAG TPA: hypothetical protein VGJ70_08200, partial [Solirubrobacteraceae bacterium]
MTFAQMHDALTRAGLEVGVALRGGRHAITVDGGAGRRVALAVDGGFDRTAAVLVASMRLREHLGPMPEICVPDAEVRGRWPEFLEIA